MTKAEDTRGSVAGAPAARITLVEGSAGKADTAAALRRDRDAIRRIFETGEYPYKQKLTRKVYEQHKAELQVELLKAQDWVKEAKRKIVILFEGRDAAGKGGTIKRFTEHLNPRGARVVALDKPTGGEKTEWFFQRYVHHLPRGGEIVLFDRSWYNRAGVERVMGFCGAKDYLEFMRQTPETGAHVCAQWDYPVQVLVLGHPQGTEAPFRGAREGCSENSGNCRRSTASRLTNGMTILTPRMPCSSIPTPPTRPGQSSSPTTKSAPA